ncbi:hypothetical protein C5167_040542 [Papaver somniferum]|uniref:Uncharacterized protein n=1 Tax=Papaver somniferum TaxID=3469 RepID=A0A4Y7IIS3_PAPSO|nr:hypothetical protein C5167_040542 [Papaver somniferum]
MPNQIQELDLESQFLSTLGLKHGSEERTFVRGICSSHASKAMNVQARLSFFEDGGQSIWIRSYPALYLFGKEHVSDLVPKQFIRLELSRYLGSGMLQVLLMVDYSGKSARTTEMFFFCLRIQSKGAIFGMESSVFRPLKSDDGGENEPLVKAFLTRTLAKLEKCKHA